MKPLEKNNGEAAKICVPIVEQTVEEGLTAIVAANRLADLIELRMDYLKEGGLGDLRGHVKKPLIVTQRRQEEGGQCAQGDRKRMEILKEAIELGAEFIDVEHRSDTFALHDLIAAKNKKKTKMILSHHDFQGTPSQEELQGLCDRMVQIDADVLKIVTFARSWEDNLRILSLIPYAKRRSKKMVAFCMGEKGKMSRVLAPLLGAPWTYASLRKDRSSAPGQLEVARVRELLRRMGDE